LNKLTDIEKSLKQLGMRYAKSDAFNTFGTGRRNGDNGSTFWRTDIGYTVKYKMAQIPKTNSVETEDRN